MFRFRIYTYCKYFYIFYNILKIDSALLSRHKCSASRKFPTQFPDYSHLARKWKDFFKKLLV